MNEYEKKNMHSFKQNFWIVKVMMLRLLYLLRKHMTIEGCRAVKEISFYNTLILSENNYGYLKLVAMELKKYIFVKLSFLFLKSF